MTLEEVAAYLRLSRSKLYSMAQSGAIPCSKVAGRWRFFRPEVDAWMLQQRPAPATSPREDGGDLQTAETDSAFVGRGAETKPVPEREG
ncbi:MAG: helix-turn-helix domain-containing protein [Myxococcales bacterium]|nr:helix-turn-helix domain-containing protein [Myxococcales bacterium]